MRRHYGRAILEIDGRQHTKEERGFLLVATFLSIGFGLCVGGATF